MKGKVIDMKVTEIRKLSSSDLRNLCIRNKWYNSGDNESYSAMLSKCNKDNITTDDIVSIAKDIMNNTNLASFNSCEVESAILAVFCFEIARCCRTHFEIEEKCPF